jgi:thioredoxin 1
MTANKIRTALVVSAVFSALLLSGAATARSLEALPVLQSDTSKITMADIDEKLTSGPVFIEFETRECGYCKQQRPISEALADEYQGKATFIFVDAKDNRDIAKTFQVSGVPQIDVIADKKDGQYVYVGKDGTTSGSIAGSKFVGLTQKDTLRTALDAAVRLRG